MSVKMPECGNIFDSYAEILFSNPIRWGRQLGIKKKYKLMGKANWCQASCHVSSVCLDIGKLLSVSGGRVVDMDI